MEVNHEKLKKLILKSYQTKRPLFIAGNTGIGKSFAVRAVAEELAKKEERIFIDWNRVSDSEKQALYDDHAKRERAFILADIRTSLLDPSDLRGLPKLNGKDFVEWRSNLLFKVFSLDATKGILFFDEINLSPPSVQSASYQIILDKCIGELALNPDVCILAAGNRVEDSANVFDMARPLKNRFTHVTLNIPTVEEWVDWAMNNDIDDRIVTYIQFKPVHLMEDLSKIKDRKAAAFASPRTWQFCSELIHGETDIKDLQMYISSAVGDGIGMEFSSFIKLREKIDLDKILDHPEMAKGLEIDMKWSLMSAISEKYRANKKILNKALVICDYLEPEWSVTLLRMLKRQKESDFVTAVIKCENWSKVFAKYGKFIADKANI